MPCFGFRSLALIGILSLLVSCAKEDLCTVCGYYTGLSQQVIPQPGTNLGSYFTATKSYLLQEKGNGFEVAGMAFTPDESGMFRDEPDSIAATAKGYLLFEGAIRNDSLFFEVRRAGGFNEIFAGRRI